MIITRINQIIFLCIVRIKEETICSLVNSLVLTEALVLWVRKEVRPRRNWKPGARIKRPRAQFLTRPFVYHSSFGEVWPVHSSDIT